MWHPLKSSTRGIFHCPLIAAHFPQCNSATPTTAFTPAARLMFSRLGSANLTCSFQGSPAACGIGWQRTWGMHQQVQTKAGRQAGQAARI